MDRPGIHHRLSYFARRAARRRGAVSRKGFPRRHGRHSKGDDQMITRRGLLVVLTAGSLSTALPAFAQQRARSPKIGVLWHAGSAEEEKIPLGGLVEGFKDLGYVDGRNIVLEHRFPNEQPERFFTLAAELVQIKVDVL